MAATVCLRNLVDQKIYLKILLFLWFETYLDGTSIRPSFPICLEIGYKVGACIFMTGHQPVCLASKAYKNLP